MLNIQSFRFDAYDENSYIVFNDNLECFIIDPGCYFDFERSSITNYIRYFNLEVKGLLVTHSHIDHILGLQYLNNYYPDKPLYIHEMEYKVLKNMPKICKEAGFEIEDYIGNPIFVKEKDLVKLGDEEFQILFTPGHTQNSISFYSPDNNILFSGDVIFKTKIGKVDLPGGNLTQLITTIKSKIFTLPEATIIYPGHGLTTTVGYEKTHNKMEIWT